MGGPRTERKETIEDGSGGLVRGKREDAITHIWKNNTKQYLCSSLMGP